MNSINISHIEAKIMTRNHIIDGKDILIVRWILTYNNRIYISDILKRNKLITENMIIKDIKVRAFNIYFSDNILHRFISDTKFFHYGDTYHLLEEIIVKVNKERFDNAIKHTFKHRIMIGMI